MAENCFKCGKKLSMRDSFVWEKQPVCKSCLRELDQSHLQKMEKTGMKKFKDLTAEDFPGIDEQKFNEWRDAVDRANKNSLIALGVLIIVNIFTFLLLRSFILGGILLLVVMIIINSKPKRLFKQLGISSSDIKRARRGEKVEIKKTT